MQTTFRWFGVFFLLLLAAAAVSAQSLADLAKSKNAAEKKKARVVITNQPATKQTDAMTAQLPSGDRKDNPGLSSSAQGGAGSKKASSGSSSRSASKAKRASEPPPPQDPYAENPGMDGVRRYQGLPEGSASRDNAKGSQPAGFPGKEVKPSSSQPAEVRPSSSQAARETPSDRASRKYATTGSSPGRR